MFGDGVHRGEHQIAIHAILVHRECRDGAGLFEDGTYGLTRFRKNLEGSIFGKVVIRREVQSINRPSEEVGKICSCNLQYALYFGHALFTPSTNLCEPSHPCYPPPVILAFQF